jgi:predicted metal-dependent phosphoesterase TrpH
MLKADLHVHTQYSMDCTSSLDQIIARCQKIGINCLAIADHGTIAGALKMEKLAPFRIIVAEEILTPSGEIMGMFLNKEIPSPLSVEETIKRIKDQDGLVCIPHPYDKIRTSAFTSNKELEKIMASIDIIEVFNARSLFPGTQARAQKLAQKFAKIASAGSDAHITNEIGNYYIEMEEFADKNDFLKSLSQSKVKGHKSNPLVHWASTHSKFRKKLSGEN